MAKTTAKVKEKKKEVKPIMHEPVVVEKTEPLKVETPYPKDHKKADVDFIGEELVKLSNRLNEIELSVNDMSTQLKQVRSRMGLV